MSRAASARAAFDRAEQLGLPCIPELGHGAFLSRRNEDRVVPEAFVPARFESDDTVERAARAELGPVGPERDELAHVPSTPIVDAVELRQQMPDVIGGPASRMDSWPPPERVDLDPRVLARNPRVDRSV